MIRLKRVKAFTLIEIMIVITVIGILGSIMIVSVKGRKEQQKLEACKANILTIADSVEGYKVSNGYYPSKTGAAATYSLTGAAIANGFKIGTLPKCPVNPSTNPYKLETTYNGYTIYCSSDHQSAGYAKNYPKYRRAEFSPSPEWINNSSQK